MAVKRVSPCCRAPRRHFKNQIIIDYQLAECQIEPLDLSISTRSSSTDSISTNSIRKTTRKGSRSPVLASRPFECKQCIRAFTTAERLRAHTRRHEIKDSGRYTCTACTKPFVQQSSLITHKRIHSGEKPYECKVCEKRYGDLSTFTKHQRTHTGEKPYTCTICERKFSQSGNCLRHMRSVHDEE